MQLRFLDFHRRVRWHLPLAVLLAVLSISVGFSQESGDEETSGRSLSIDADAFGLGAVTDKTELTFDEPRGGSYVQYFDRFAEAVFEGREPDVPGEEGRKTLEVLLGAYESGKTNEPVMLQGA